MSLEELTLREIKEAASLLKNTTKPNIDDTFAGQKVMVRTYSAGVHFGTLVAKQGQSVILKDSRRVYSWSGAATLSQLAQEGSKNLKDCKICMTIPQIQLDRVIETQPMSVLAIDILYGASAWKL